MKNNTVKAQFDARSSEFSRSASWVTNPGLLAAHRRALKGLLPAGGRLLEACCGTGEVTGALKRPGLETYGLDVSSGMLKKAARHIRHLKRGDAHKLPYPAAFFDAVVIRQAMQFLRPAAFLKEARRVLKPGGALLLSHHVPADAAERAQLLKVYRLIQPSGVFKDPAKLYLARELARAIRAAGFKLRAATPFYTTESVTALMKCYPNLPAEQKERIAREYLDAPAPFRRACRVARRRGELCARWKWALFTAVK
ncbi:MAG TPA: class I SAM-dependent methyltransferase [Elusimicrobiales bacterium]|nr:class I SAM-dependent methyltransferase [Elusimicrobiales bacterium]